MFEIERSDHLAGNNQIAKAGSVSFQRLDYVIGKLLAARRPITLLQLVWGKLHVYGHHVFAGGRERWISDRGNVDVDIRRRRKLTVLTGIEGALEVVDFGTDVDAA